MPKKNFHRSLIAGDVQKTQLKIAIEYLWDHNLEGAESN